MSRGNGYVVAYRKADYVSAKEARDCGGLYRISDGAVDNNERRVMDVTAVANAALHAVGAEPLAYAFELFDGTLLAVGQSEADRVAELEATIAAMKADAAKKADTVRRMAANIAEYMALVDKMKVTMTTIQKELEKRLAAATRRGGRL